MQQLRHAHFAPSVVFVLLRRSVCLATLVLFIAELLAQQEPKSVAKEIHEVLKTKVPAFKPKQAEAAPVPQDTENPIIFLPRVVVEESKFPSLPGKALLSPKGLREYAAKRFPGQGSRARDPASDPALLSLADEERLRQLEDLGVLAKAIEISGDKSGSRELRRETQRALMRRRDWKTEDLDNLVNRGRR